MSEAFTDRLHSFGTCRFSVDRDITLAGFCQELAQSSFVGVNMETWAQYLADDHMLASFWIPFQTSAAFMGAKQRAVRKSKFRLVAVPLRHYMPLQIHVLLY